MVVLDRPYFSPFDNILLQNQVASLENLYDPIASFLVPSINGTACTVSGHVRAVPGSRIVPDGCDVASSNSDVSVNLPYVPRDIQYGYIAGSTLSVCPTSTNCVLASNPPCIMSMEKCPIPWSSPAVALLDSSGVIVDVSKLHVTVSLATLSSSNDAVLSGEVTAQSCCRQPDCLSLYAAGMQTCCDCLNPACALCVTPVNGIVSFSGLRVLKIGVYALEFSTTLKDYQGTSGLSSLRWLSTRVYPEFQIEPVCKPSLTHTPPHALHLQLCVHLRNCMHFLHFGLCGRRELKLSSTSAMWEGVLQRLCLMEGWGIAASLWG